MKLTCRIKPNDLFKDYIYINLNLCKHIGEMLKAYSILVGNPEGKRPLRRPRCRWGNNIRIHRMEI